GPGEHRHAVHRRPARATAPLPEGASPHGADPEHLVPALRSQPAALRAEHLRGQAGGLPGADAPRVAYGAVSLAPRHRRDAGCWERRRRSQQSASSSGAQGTRGLLITSTLSNVAESFSRKAPPNGRSVPFTPGYVRTSLRLTH